MIVLANVLQPLIDFCESILKFFHDQFGFGWGASIIGLTVVIRLLILPLTFKGVRSMQALQRLQPEIKKIQERYKDDKQRMNQEMMAFYQEQKVNPLSSCLPLLLQLPFFIALFYMLRKDLRIDICGQSGEPCGDVPGSTGHEFLFIPDITDRATGGVLITLVVLYVATQLGASLVTAFSADPMQRRIMLALPFVFVVFIINFESGLIVYWITTNVWTVGQQLFVKKFLPPPEPLAAGDGARAAVKPARGKPAPEKPARAQASGGDGAESRKAPPPPPRRKRKRSGRRR
jgi:YidC/Oxa1 family membrane protein insertase